MADPKKREANLQYAKIDVSRLLEGAHPRLIDEWQDAPQFWDAIRSYVDHAEGEGHFILTGSSVVPRDEQDKIVHSGTGRIARLKMRPMSLWESGESSGTVSLGALFSGAEFVSAQADACELDRMTALSSARSLRLSPEFLSTQPGDLPYEVRGHTRLFP